ncbi:MAG TPA: DsbE family thiol:disulfide interchange protein [Hyphomicrobiales bacterium]|nr:DsbE family thiol:disulfide interchange protein [Hyphomicrobiales bacterium]
MSSRSKLFIPAAFFLIMLGLLFYGLGRDPNHVPSALVNRPLPEFSKPALFDEATTVDSSELRGGIFLVNVWATWCPPCHVEHPYLLEISQREKNVTFVGVNYKDDVGAARDFLTQRGNPFKYNLVDADGRLGIDLGVAGAPETFIVDANGTIRYRHVGVIDNRVWAETIEPILAQIQ